MKTFWVMAGVVDVIVVLFIIWVIATTNVSMYVLGAVVTLLAWQTVLAISYLTNTQLRGKVLAVWIINLLIMESLMIFAVDLGFVILLAMTVPFILSIWEMLGINLCLVVSWVICYRILRKKISEPEVISDEPEEEVSEPG